MIPPDSETAYRVAGMVVEIFGWEVVGWKIAATNAEMRRVLRTGVPIYGRVYAPNVRQGPFAVDHSGLCSPIPEVEYQFRLGADLLPRRKSYTGKEVTEMVASMYPGIELAECLFLHDKNFPPLPGILADGSGGATLIYGLAIEDWSGRDISGQEVVLYNGGKYWRSGTAAAALVHPLAPLTWLANELSRAGIGLKSGQMVSTGTLTGMFRPQQGQTYRADFGRLGEVTLTLT